MMIDNRALIKMFYWVRLASEYVQGLQKGDSHVEEYFHYETDQDSICCRGNVANFRSLKFRKKFYDEQNLELLLRANCSVSVSIR